MDDVIESLGRLSTDAKEWKPGMRYGGNHNDDTTGGSYYGEESGWHPHPDVKEFIPGNLAMNNTGDEALIGGGGYSGYEGEYENNTSDLLDKDTTRRTPASIPSDFYNGTGMSESAWSFYRALSIDSLREMDPTDGRHKAVPPSFSHAFSLDESDERRSGGDISSSSSSFGYPSSVFKVRSREDGRLYCLRRLDNVKCVSHKIAASVTERWSCLTEHPGVCRLYKCFVKRGSCIFFLHHYYPGAVTLQDHYLQRPHPHSFVQPLPESLIWSCITQLVAVIGAIHSRHLAARSLQPNHILCIPQEPHPHPYNHFPKNKNNTNNTNHFLHTRYRLSSIGVLDALECEARKPLLELQQTDIRHLGFIILSLATRQPLSPNNTNLQRLHQYLQFLAHHYTPQLLAFVQSIVLPNNNSPPPSILNLTSSLSQHAFHEMTYSNTTVDHLHTHLSQEYTAGRALRLLLKLGFINERPEFNQPFSNRWSETGDCYVLKLFRDYVFHQVDPHGRPVMDYGHVVSALNKLDTADDEKIVLTSRDGENLLVVSFADVARCLESAFMELCEASSPQQQQFPSPRGGPAATIPGLDGNVFAFGS